MKKIILNLTTVLLTIVYSTITQAQNVGINTSGSAPDASAMLDVSSTSKGLLIPRVALTSRSSNAPIGAGITTSLLIYNTATAGIAPNNVVPGYYYWDGSAWVSLSGGTGGRDWSLTGNTGTSPVSNFIGTIDNQDFVIKTNNSEVVRVMSDGKVGIGNPSPTGELDLQGTDRTDFYISTTGTGDEDYADIYMLTNGSGNAGIWRNSATKLLYGGAFSLNFGTIDADDVTLVTSNESRLLVDGSTGYVGIGSPAPAVPSEELEVVGDVEISGNVGIGTDVSADVGEFMGKTFNASSYDQYGYRSYVFTNPPANSGNELYGAQLSARASGSSNFGTCNGIMGLAANQGNGTLDNAQGLLGQVSLFGPPAAPNNGNITNGRAILALTPNRDTPGNSGTITNMTGVYIANQKTAFVTNAIGLYLENTTGHSIYSNGGNSYFAGNVGIGDDNPSAKLHLKDGHMKSTQTTAPTITAASTYVLASQSISNATDVAGKLSITTTAAAGSVTITFNTNYNVPPIVMLTPTNAAAATDINRVFVTTTTSTFRINFSASPAAGVHTYNYQVIETQ